MSSNLIGQTLLNQYRVDAFVASGGMGVVYRVWDLKRNVPLAMKVLHSELAEDPSMFKRFQREANALKKLAHPNIVPFYGLFQTRQFDFLLERFIDGPSLKEILQQHHGKPLQLNEALIYLKTLCAALGYAHTYKSGVVHCDVKPGNVMVDRGGSVYLTDFGIARHADSTTTTMGTAGTPAYMAPEQIRGEPVSPATDIYALGVVLYEMLTGQRPFRGNEAGTEKGGTTVNERIRYGHLHLQPPDPRSVNPAITVGMASAILKALAKRPQDRYASTLDFFNAICIQAGETAGTVADRVVLPLDFIKQDALPGQEHIGGDQEDYPPVPAPWWRSHWLIIGGVVVCALIIGGIVLISGQPGSRLIIVPALQLPATVTQASASVEPPVVAQPISTSPVYKTPSKIHLNTSLSESQSPQPTKTQPASLHTLTNGDWIAYSYNPMPNDIQNKRDLYMINWKTGSQKQITFGNNGNNFPAFSPDGGSLVYTGCRGNDCLLYERDENGNEIKITDMQSFRPDWCPDPSKPWVIFENHEGSNQVSIWMIDLGTHATKRITNGPGDYSPDWSPDCSQFAFIRDTSQARDSGDIYIYNLSSGQARQVTNTTDVDEESVSWSPTGEWLVFTQFKDDDGSGIRGDKGDNSDLAMIRPDGTDRLNLTSHKYDAYSPSWSPDGNRIVFSVSYSFNQPKNQLYIYSLSDGNFMSITDIGPYYHPAWGP